MKLTTVKFGCTKPHNLQQTLLLRLIGLILVFSSLSGFVVYRLSLSFSNQVYDEWLLDTARTLAILVQSKPGHLSMDLPEATLRAMLWDEHDQLAFRIDSQKQGLIAGQADLPPFSASTEPIRYTSLTFHHQPMRAVLLTRPDHHGDTIHITLIETMHKRHRLASQVLFTVMGVSALLALLTVLFMRHAITRALKPLFSLAHTLQNRQDGDMTHLADHHLPAELKAFTSAINGLLTKLNQAIKQQQRFLTDAAHQLRTPLAALKIELEHAIRETDPAKHSQALTWLHTGVNRMSRLAGQLLSLARAEPGQVARPSFQQLNLYELAQRVGTELIESGRYPDIDLGLEGEPATQLTGEPFLVEEALLNLLDNAVKYAGEQARITIRVQQDEQATYLTVEDNGPGVAPSELAQLGERFYRPANSPASGSGLGLAIVRDMAQTHHGSLMLTLIKPHGLSAQLRFPR